MTTAMRSAPKMLMSQERHDQIAKALQDGWTWRRIKGELGASTTTISLISKEISAYGDDEKANWQKDIDQRAQGVLEKIVEQMEMADISRLSLDKQAISYGILYDKLHPKTKDTVTVQVAIQQTLDIARNATAFKDV